MLKRILILLAVLIAGVLHAQAQQDSPQTARKLVVGVNNASVTGTTIWRLAKLTGAPSTAVIVATTDTDGAIGVVTAGAGITLTATIQVEGLVKCDFDGATTAGDYVQISSTTAGKCHDTGSSSYPSSGQVLGRVLSTNGGAGNYQMVLAPIAAKGFGAGFIGSGTSNTVAKFTGTTAIGNSSITDNGTTITTTETLSSGAITVNDATTPWLTTASGKTNTGFVQVNGKTSGALKVTAADATAQTVTLTTAAQTTGAGTLTIPDLAGTSKTVPLAPSAGPVTFIGPTAARTVTLPDSNTSVPSATQTLTFTGPTAGRTITLPDANFTAARTDTGQNFSGTNTFSRTGLNGAGQAGIITQTSDAKTANDAMLMTFNAQDSNGNATQYGVITNTILDPVDGTEDSYFTFGTFVNGSNADRMVVGYNGNVGIGDSTPASMLTVGSGDKFQVNSSGLPVQSNGVALAGFGFPSIVQAPAITGTQTGNVTVFSFSPPATAGLVYEVSGVITTTSGTNTGTVQFTLDYRDSQGTTHTADIIPLVDAAGAVGTTKTGASKEFHATPWQFTINNAAIAIALKVVVTGSVNYTVTGTLRQVR